MPGQLTLVLGGVASGKSDFAEALVLAAGGTPIYVATAEPNDDEMRAKITAHQAARAGAGWKTREAPHDLHAALTNLPASATILIDCATMLISNLLSDGRDPDAIHREFVKSVTDCLAPIVIVSNEVGLGGVSPNAMARKFAAAQGRLNRELAQQAQTVVQVVAGLPLVVKGALRDA